METDFYPSAWFLQPLVLQFQLYKYNTVAHNNVYSIKINEAKCFDLHDHLQVHRTPSEAEFIYISKLKTFSLQNLFSFMSSNHEI
jgi:hypothetical protein